ncbi:unnamed protein product [Amoebophrya sp. A120]|nr:unnamed protein product [Amoebophrya sp. A120]|eukprot:GSA120T00019649001.1
MAKSSLYGFASGVLALTTTLRGIADFCSFRDQFLLAGVSGLQLQVSTSLSPSSRAAAARPSADGSGPARSPEAEPTTFMCCICHGDFPITEDGHPLCVGGDHRVNKEICKHCYDTFLARSSSGPPPCPLCRRTDRPVVSPVYYNRAIEIAGVRVLFKMRYAAHKAWLALLDPAGPDGGGDVPVLSGAIRGYANKYGTNYKTIWNRIRPQERGTEESIGAYEKRVFTYEKRVFTPKPTRVEDRGQQLHAYERALDVLALLFGPETSDHHRFSLSSITKPNGAFASHHPYTEEGIESAVQSYYCNKGNRDEDDDLEQAEEALKYFYEVKKLAEKELEQNHAELRDKILDAIVEWQWATHTKFCRTDARVQGFTPSQCLRETRVSAPPYRRLPEKGALPPASVPDGATLSGEEWKKWQKEAREAFSSKPLPCPFEEKTDALGSWMEILGVPNNPAVVEAYMEMGKRYTKAIARDFLLGEVRLVLEGVRMPPPHRPGKARDWHGQILPDPTNWSRR